MKKLVREKVKLWMRSHAISLEEIAITLSTSQMTAYGIITGKTFLRKNHIDMLEAKYPHFDVEDLAIDQKKNSDIIADRLAYLEKENARLRNQVEILNFSLSTLLKKEDKTYLQHTSSLIND
jgi:serine phosphatase RsbU (regulator of sigma subunit)